MPLQTLLDLRFSGVMIEDASFAYENASGRVSTKDLRPAQLIFSSELGPTRRGVLLQSFYSPIFALLGILVTLPLALIAALAVLLTSRGGVLYRQIRVGKNGVPFTLYKFRSMYADAEDAAAESRQASSEDERIFPFGRFMRRRSLDEFPQFWNVLTGDMSIVGPRPYMPLLDEEFRAQTRGYRTRHLVKPGITGLAQSLGYRGEILEQEMLRRRVQWDVHYITHWSVWLDLKITVLTLWQVIRPPRTAY